MTSPAVDGLKEARRLVEAGWTQRHIAMDRRNVPTSSLGQAAVCFCARGALDRATGDGWNGDAVRVFERAISTPWIAGWNDEEGRTQAEVLAAFDRAIALAEAEVSP